MSGARMNKKRGYVPAFSEHFRRDVRPFFSPPRGTGGPPAGRERREHEQA